MFNKEKNILISLFKNERKIILAGLIAGVSIFVFYLLFLHTSLYSTKCKIYAKNIEKSDIVSSYGGGKSLVSESGYSNPLFNLYEVLTSENMANKIYPVIKEKYPEDLAKLNVHSKKEFFNYYPKLINSIVEPSTDIVIINLMWPNKKHAPIVLYEIVKQFKGENLVVKKTGEVQKRKFIDKQTTEIDQKLEKVRNKIKNYKQLNGIANITVETENTINQRAELEKEARILNSQIQYNKRKLLEFAEELKISNAEIALRATGIGTDPYIIKLSQDLASAKQKYANLKGVFKDKYPTVISAKNEIDKLQNLITERKKETSANINIPRAIYDSSSSVIVTNFALTQAEMASLQAQLNSLQEAIKQLKEKENKLPEIQVGLDELKKLEEALAGAYQNVKQKQIEANIKESEIIDNLIILNHPSKASPLRFFLLTRFIGFMLLGTLLGLAIAYIKQGLEDKWIDIDEMRNLTGQNVLGPIPWVKDFDTESAHNIINAAYTNIASEITSKAYLKESFILSFISNSKHQSKSLITESISIKVAETDRSVLLIDLVSKDTNDFDLIKAIKLINKEIRYNNEEQALNPALQDSSSSEQSINNKQLSEKIHNILKDAIKKQFNEDKTEILNFQKIEANIQSENLNDFIASKAFKYILNILKNHYEFIFINSPHGFVLLPEIQTLKKLSEGIVLISSLKTSKQNLIKLSQNLSNSDINTLGIIAREENSELEKHINTLEQNKLLEKIEQELINA